MVKLAMPSHEIAIEPTNLSPALAAMAAVIITPNTYGRIMRDATISVNAQCKGVQSHIDK